MNNLYIFIINKTIKSDYFKAWVLAQVRHIVTAVGTALVAKGLADNAIVEQVLGTATMIASFYLANLDVKGVDGKIKIALATAPEEYVPPVSVTAKVETSELPPIQ